MRGEKDASCVRLKGSEGQQEESVEEGREHGSSPGICRRVDTPVLFHVILKVLEAGAHPLLLGTDWELQANRGPKGSNRMDRSWF